MSLYTEDVCAPGGKGEEGGDDMWESVIIKNDIVQDWNVTSEQRCHDKQRGESWMILKIIQSGL